MLLTPKNMVHLSRCFDRPGQMMSRLTSWRAAVSTPSQQPAACPPRPLSAGWSRTFWPGCTPTPDPTRSGSHRAGTSTTVFCENGRSSEGRRKEVYNFTRFSLSELLTTLILETAIALAARIGLSWRRKLGAHSAGASTPAAIGIKAVL